MTFAGKFSAGLSKPNFQRPQDFSTSWWYLFDSVVGNAFNLSSGTFLGTFLKELQYHKSLGFDHFFSAFPQKIQAALFKQPSTCPEKHFEGKKWFERPEIFRWSSNLENETLGFLVENFQQACRNWVLQVKWNVLSIFFWNKLHFLSFFDFQFLFFIKNCRNFFWQVYQNWNQNVTMTFFESDVETSFRLSSGT